MQKPGRNDPCYCGSGEKYKKCHMKIDQEKEQERRSWLQAAQYVRRDLLAFARDERFAEAFAAALPFYWNDLYTVENAEEMSQAEALRFFDWFMFDYALPDGTRPLDAYVAARRGDLSAVQQQVLDRWAAEVGPAGAYTLADYDAETLHLRDFVSTDPFTVAEPGGRGQVEIGEVLLCRLVPMYDHLAFSTTAAYLPAAEIGDLHATLLAAREAYLAEHPQATHAEFMRRHNHLLIHHALAQAARVGRPPVARLDPNRPDKKTQKMVRAVKKRVA
ncbi:MAG: SEC-C domain-containing protein [Anaerolineales bacterium]|nr:SEC-C domain-containing protein [Anaerolineales bacterium]